MDKVPPKLNHKELLNQTTINQIMGIISSELNTLVMNTLSHKITEILTKKIINDKSENDLFTCLSKREKEVAELVCQGLSNAEIAEMLFVCEKTVKFHVTSIFRKFNINSRSKFIVYALTRR